MSENEEKIDPVLEAFLDLDSYAKRREFMIKNGSRLSDRMLDFIAMSMDFTLNDTGIFDKKDQIMQYIRMQEKYECGRFR